MRRTAALAALALLPARTAAAEVLDGWPCAGCITVTPPAPLPDAGPPGKPDPALDAGAAAAGASPRPLLVALHGDGGALRPMVRAWKAAAAAAGAILLVPSCPRALGCKAGSWWQWLETSGHDPDWLGAQIDAVTGRFAVDRRRIYATGYSGGATYLGWYVPAHAARFAAVAHVAGGNAYRSPCPACKVPVLFVLGAGDPMIGPYTRPLHDWYASCGGHEIVWETLPGVTHDSIVDVLQAGRAVRILDWLTAHAASCAEAAAPAPPVDAGLAAPAGTDPQPSPERDASASPPEPPEPGAAAPPRVPPAPAGCGCALGASDQPSFAFVAAFFAGLAGLAGASRRRRGRGCLGSGPAGWYTHREHVGQGFESNDVTRIERGAVGLAVAGSAVALLFVYLLAMGLHSQRLAASGLTQMLALVWLFLLALFRNLWKGSAERTTVRANRHGLWVGGEFSPSAALLEVRALVRRGVFVVRVTRSGFRLPLDIGVRDAAHGERLIRALDLDGAASDAPDIGADGILLRPSGRRRYIHHGRIESARVDPRRADHLDLLLRDGERVALSCRPGSAAALAQIEQGMAACAGDASTSEASLLQRGDRALRGWIEQLRAVGQGAGAAHRTAPVRPDRLWRIVESPGARPALRAAAAVALGPRLDARDRDRLRTAASSITAPRLRITLEAAASAAPETELLALLAGVEEEDPSRAVSGGS